MGGLRSSTKHHGKVVATQPPQMRTIFWYGGQHQHFMFPHSLYVAYYTRNEGSSGVKYWLNRLHVAFSLEPFKFDGESYDLDQRLYGLPLANYDVGMAICFYEWPGLPDPKSFMDRVVSQWWSSPFQNYQDSFSHWLNTYATHKPSFTNEWLAASKERNYQWLLDQSLIMPPYNVTLRKLFSANATLTEETDYFPDINIRGNNGSREEKIRALAHRKWVNAGCPPDSHLSKVFWADAEAEID